MAELLRPVDQRSFRRRRGGVAAVLFPSDLFPCRCVPEPGWSNCSKSINRSLVSHPGRCCSLRLLRCHPARQHHLVLRSSPSCPLLQTAAAECRAGFPTARTSLCPDDLARASGVSAPLLLRCRFFKREKCDILVFLLGANIRYCSLSKKMSSVMFFMCYGCPLTNIYFARPVLLDHNICVIVFSWDYNFECLWSDNLQYRIIV